MDLTQNMTGRNCSLFVVFSIWHEKHDLENVSVFSDRPSLHIVLGSFSFFMVILGCFVICFVYLQLWLRSRFIMPLADIFDFKLCFASCKYAFAFLFYAGTI